MVNRRQVIQTLYGASLATTLGSLPFKATSAHAQTSGLTPVTIGVGGFTFAYLPLFTAYTAGFMQEEGLNVSFVNANGGANALAAMLGGSVDFCGLVMSDMLLAATKGQKVQAFAPLMSQYASDAVISVAAAEKAGITADMPIAERMSRLKGMKLAISSRGSGIDKLWRYLVSLGGLDPDRDVTLTVVKLDQMYPALMSGQIDGFNTTAPANNRAVEEGLAVWVARPSQGEVPGLENFLYTVLAAKPDYLAANEDVASRLVKGLAKGASLIHSDTERTANLLHDRFFSQTDANLVATTVADQVSTVADPMKMTEEQFNQNIEFMKRFGHDVSNVALSDVINSRWL